MKIPEKAFHVKQINIKNGMFSLSKDESKHALKVLRLKMGDKIVLVDGKSKGYFGTINDINSKKLSGTVDKVLENFGENQNIVHISPGLIKKNRFEILLEKATELGVKEIHPIIMERSVLKSINMDRCKKILISSAKQCRRSFFPIIHEPKGLESLLTTNENYLFYACHLEVDSNLSTFNENKNDPINIIIGPEGGFSNKELKIMDDKGVSFFGLGNRRLRAETAAINSIILLNKMADL